MEHIQIMQEIYVIFTKMRSPNQMKYIVSENQKYLFDQF